MKTKKKVRAAFPLRRVPARPARRLLREQLITAAAQALEFAVVPYSHFPVGAALIAQSGEIINTKLPGFSKPSVAGHDGKLFIGWLGGTPVIVLSGRSHFCEGHSMARVTFAVRALADYGIRDLLLTNAAGGINRKFRAGDFMLLTDHINLMGVNPLRGTAITGLPRFVDLTRTYDAKLSALLVSAARMAKTKLQRGVYLAVSGPSYETPAEIRAFARLGADAVGMSTVPEVIVARQCGLRVAAVSYITNLAAGISKSRLSHEEVLETGGRVKTQAARWLKTFAKLYGRTNLAGRMKNEE